MCESGRFFSCGRFYSFVHLNRPLKVALCYRYTICGLVADLVCVAYSKNSGRFCRGGCGRLNRFVVVTSQQQPLLLASEQKGHIKKKWELRQSHLNTEQLIYISALYRLWETAEISAVRYTNLKSTVCGLYFTPSENFF